MTLKELLTDWTDQDIAQYYLACSLGLLNYDNSEKSYHNAKWVFWTGNQFQTMFGEILDKMVQNDVLEVNDDGFYRWNPSFKGDWEKELK